ncbi:MAG: PAS domain S-box protein, partial [Gammaproteobacteria bacterium]
IKDTNGIITHAVAAFNDISLLKQQEARIREEETLHRALLDSAIDAIITINETGTIIRVNPAAVNMFGYSQQELLGSNVKLLVPEPDRSQHDAYIQNFLQTGQSKIIGIGREVEAQCKDGRLLPCDLAITEVKLPNKRLFKGILRDISERKRIELMEKEFIATVSHELRTPLTSISGSLKLLENEVSGELGPLAKELLEIACINVERLILLVNDILDIEKLESGAMKFDLKPERLLNLVEQSVSANQGYAEQHATRIEIIPNSVDADVFVDKNRFIQVLSNLLSNAAKFSPEGCPVRVSTEVVGDNIRVTVADQGAGVPEHFKDQLFEKFAQAEHADNAKKGGTGLGLCIAKGMIERMRGQIGYDSEPGQGSRFFVELPIYKTASEPSSQQNSQTEYSSESAQRLLICEDDADVAKLLKIMLMKKGFQADVVHTWTKALELLQNSDYAAMILDLMLPDVHWITLFEELRQNDKTRHLPVIVVSAIADEAKYDINISTINIYDWLSKPIDENRLTQAVSEVLLQQNKAELRPSILFLEDEPAQAQKIVSLLRGLAHVVIAHSVKEANDYLTERAFNLIMIDMNLSEISELKLQARQEAGKPPIPVMVLSGKENEQKILFEVQQISMKSQSSDESLIDTVQRLIRSQT